MRSGGGAGGVIGGGDGGGNSCRRSSWLFGLDAFVFDSSIHVEPRVPSKLGACSHRLGGGGAEELARIVT